MPIPILMPALSPTMEKGKLARWLVKEGDAVAPGDVLAEIDTDKATMEVESVDEGVVGKLMISEGTDDVPVNQTIAVLLGEGEDESAIADAIITPDAPGSHTPAPDAATDAPARPAARPLVPPPAVNGQSGRVFASPLARRLARQNGLDLGALKGSGPHGRVVRRDVDQALAAGTAKAAPSPASPAVLSQPMSDDATLKLFEPGSYELVPHDNMRKTIARRLTQSKQTVPHFYLSIECALDNLLAARAGLNAAAPAGEDGKPAYKISVNDFIIKALAMALQRVPEANASWTDAAMVMHKRCDVGVAVAIPGGLITPVVRSAETKGLAAISNEMKDFVARARKRKLMPEEYQGGATAVSNLGMFGVANFSAVINPPHATILAVGAGEKRPVVVGENVVVRTMMTVTLSTDHRAVDGALGARLLQAFKAGIEEPAMMLV